MGWRDDYVFAIVAPLFLFAWLVVAVLGVAAMMVDGADPGLDTAQTSVQLAENTQFSAKTTSDLYRKECVTMDLETQIEMRAENHGLKAINQSLCAEIEDLVARIVELEAENERILGELAARDRRCRRQN